MKEKDDQVSKLSTKQIVSWFVASMHSSNNFGTDRVNNSVALLRRVPAARHAVLQRFTQLFEEAIKCSMDSMDYSGAVYGMSQEMNNGVQIVVNTLNELLEKNSEAWAPILCEWSVESLGQISSSFKQGNTITGTSSHSSSKLNELVSFWLQAFPTRMLMNIYRYCLKSLIDRGAESCMDSLLATSARHAPNFDWVVADVGNAFPSEIINRVLRTGFRDFAKQQWGQEPMDEDQSETKSVVRILEHLSKRHADRVRKAMIELYQTPSVSDGSGQVKVILYIMQLLSDSPLLIKISTKSFIELLDDRNLNLLHTQFCKLPNFRSSLETVCSLAVHLICQSSEGSFQLIQLLLRTSSDSRKSKGLDKPVKEIFRQVMASLFQDLLRIAMRKQGIAGERKENGVVHELKMHYKQLCDELLESNATERQEWILMLMKIISVRGRACSVLSRLLAEISSQTHVHLFLKLFSFISSVFPVLLEQVLEHSFCLVSDGQLNNQQIKNLLKNLWRLLSRNVEMPGSYEIQSRLHRSLWNHVKDLRMHVSSNPCQEAAASAVYIISTLLTAPVPMLLDVSLFPLSQTLASYFFRLLHLGKVNNDPSMTSCRRALVHLSQTPESFAVVCQFVLESSVTQANAILFGRRTEELKIDEDGAPTTNDLCSEQRVSLLSQHRAHAAFTSVVGFAPIVVESGLIGSGPKKKKSCPLSKLAQVTNNECISLLVHRCCCKTGSSGSLEGGVIHNTPTAFDEEKLIVLGAKLFEAVTTCTPGSFLHADSAWPDPGFRKYTVERDLRIFTFLDEHPFAWNILNLLANSPKALWKCSLILRSVFGAMLHHWEASRDASAALSDCHLLHSIKVIETLGKGQLLPEPLRFIGEMFHLLSPYEVFLMMSDAWKFVHDHPLPATASCDSQHRRDFLSEGIDVQLYLAVTHSVLHANIRNMGHLFARFVPHNVKENLT